MIVIAIQLWGPGGVNDNCELYVNDADVVGPNDLTLAWLEQRSICEFTFSSLVNSGMTWLGR